MDIKKFLVESISVVRNTEEGKEIKIESKSLENSIAKYSAKKEPMWRLIINSSAVTRKTPYAITYNCYTCKKANTVSSIQFLRKLNGNGERCKICVNLEKTKRQNQSEFLTANNPKKLSKVEPQPEIAKKSTREIIQESYERFRLTEVSFQHSYFSYHLTPEEYNAIAEKIESFQGGTMPNSKNIKYLPHIITNNQMKFTPMLHDTLNDRILKLGQPIIICEICETRWKGKFIEKQKNKVKTMCKNCSFCRKTFKIRRTLNICNEILLYQSKLELKFIEWCKENGIKVENGPKVPYLFEKKRTYRVDFEIPCIKAIIEIKDNHIWHKKQVESGKWKAKLEGVQKYIDSNEDYKYLFITPENWNENIKSIQEQISALVEVSP